MPNIDIDRWINDGYGRNSDGWSGGKILLAIVIVFCLCGVLAQSATAFGNKFTPDDAFAEISARLAEEGITDARIVNHTMVGHLIQWTSRLQMTIEAGGRLYHAECMSDLYPMLCSYYEQGRIRGSLPADE